MTKTCLSLTVLSLACTAGTALAQDISSVNGYRVQLRGFGTGGSWNDFSTSNLSWGSAGAPVNPAPAPAVAPLAPFGAGLEFLEQFPTGTPGNYANQHLGMFSNDGGATSFGMNQHQSFTLNTDIRISSLVAGTRKEGGVKFFNDRGDGWIDEGEAMVASDGQVAMFGSGMTYFDFGNVYTAGTTGHLSYQYFQPGELSYLAAFRVIFTDAATGVHDSGVINWAIGDATDATHPANGFNNGSKLGFLDQNQRSPFGDDADVVYGNVSVVPTPGAFALLGLAGLTATRRRR